MIHLHTRSCYTLLESTLTIDEIIQAAIDNHQTSAVLTDRNVMFGTMEFIHKAQKAGLKPIVGLETEVRMSSADIPVVLLAKNNKGLQSLFLFSTLVSEKKEEAIPASLLKEHAPDLIVMTGGIDDSLEELCRRGENEAIASRLTELQEAAGTLYVSIALNDSVRQKDANHILKTISRNLQLPTVALSRINYLKDGDAARLRLLQAIGSQKNIQDPAVSVRAHRYYRTEEEMRQLYDEEDLAMTDVIASQISLSLPLFQSALPVYPNPKHVPSDQYLSGLCRAGLNKRRNGHPEPEYIQRLEEELKVILSMGFADYFLIVWDFIRYGRKHDILIGPGRGSAAGSLVAYCLGITHIDPIANGLLFERFLNPERISMPDIDTDIPDDRRDEMIEYVSRLYGEGHAAHIVTFARMKAKMAIRDTARAFNIHVREADQLCKALGNDPKMTLQKAYDSIPSFRSLVNSRQTMKTLFEQALSVEGLPRHISIHAGGIVLSREPIVKSAPLIDAGASIPAVQFTMEYLEELGLIKFDFLGLRNLSALHEMTRRIREDTGMQLDLLKLPMDDPKVYSLLSRADTMGIFQLESDGIRSLLKSFRPSRFEDIAAILALYRPGPMKNISLYLDARKNHQKNSLHPLLEPILAESNGIFLYQEQIMQAAQIIGGFSLAQADSLRKAMSKKNHDLMESYRSLFIKGAVGRGISREEALRIFSVMERFADYGFNKSHSYAYAMIVYQMSYIKANFPVQFYLCSLNSLMGSTPKTSAMILECRSRNLPVLNADLNSSGSVYTADMVRGQMVLRMPFTMIKGVSSLISEKIVAERNARGPFQDVHSALARLLAAGIGQSVLEVLVRGGAFDAFGVSPAGILQEMEQLLRYARMVRVDSQDTLFSFDAVSPPSIPQIPVSLLQKSAMEKEAYGFYASEHPAASFRRRIPAARSAASLKTGNGYVETVGVVTRIREHQTKQDKTMAFCTLEDESGQIDLAVMPELYQTEKQKGSLDPGKLLLVQGKKDQNRPSILVRQIEVLA